MIDMDILRFTRDGIAPSPHMLDVRDAAPRKVLLTEAGPEAWIVTRYADCKTVLGDRRFLGTGAPPPAGMPDMRPYLFRSPGWMGGDNGPLLRKIAAPLFTARRTDAMRDSVHRIARELLDAIEHEGRPADLVSGFTFPLPARVICELLGLRTDEIDDLARWSADAVTPPMFLPEERAAASWRALTDYFHLELHRKRLNPADDGLSLIGVADAPDEVLVGLAISLFVAGHETVTSQLGYGIVALLDAPDQADLVRGWDEVADTAVEEIMRFYPVNAEGVPRTAAADVEVGGVVIPEGSIVMVGGSAAAFDPAVFPDPLLFDVTRQGAPHLSFGHGAHFCVGAALARLQLRIALPALLRRFPSLRIDLDKLRFHQDLAGGLEELIVCW